MIGNKVVWQAVAVAAIGLTFSTSTSANTYTWSNSGTTWDSSSNWSTTTPGGSDVALFNLSSYSFQPSLVSPASLGGIWDTGAGSVTIGGSALTLAGTNINGNASYGIEMDAGAGSLTINAPILLGGSQTWFNNSSNLLSVSSSISLGSSVLTITDSATGGTTLSGILSGLGGLTKAGSGTGILSLTNNNTYTGVTTVYSGSVTVTGNESAATGGWNIAETGGDNTTTRTVNFNTGSTIVVGSAATFQLGINGATGNYSTVNVAGVVSNSGALNLQRASILNISSGGLWTQTGAMQLAAPVGSGFNSAMTVASGGSFIYNNSAGSLIQISPASTAVGSATLTISGAFTTNQGFTDNVASSTGTASISLAGGTLNLTANIPALTATAGSPFIINLGTGGGTLNTNGFSTAISSSISGVGGLYLAGSGQVTLTGSDTYTGGTTVGGGTLTVGAAGAINDSGSVGLNIGNGSIVNIQGLYNSTGASGKILVGGGGVLNVSGTLNYLGNGLQIGNTNGNGTINLGVGGLLESISPITSGSGASTFNFNGGTLQALGNSTSFMSGLTAANVGSGGAFINDGGHAITITQNLLSGTSPGIDGGLTKFGTGTLTLSGTNSYNGGTTVAQGILEFSPTSAMPTSGAFIVNSGATLAFPYGSAGQITSATSGLGSFGALIGTTLVGGSNSQGLPITWNAGAFVGLDTSTASASYVGTIGNTIGGALGLTKVGSNTLYLSGNNTYSAGTSINAGTLEFATTAAMPASGTVTVATGATLAVTVGGVGQFNSGTSGNGSIGALIGNTSTPGIGGQGAPVTWSSSATLGLDTSTASVTYAGAIGNTIGGLLNLTKLGSNGLTFTGANNYSGMTAINSGTVTYAGNSSYSLNSALAGAGGLAIGNVAGSEGVLNIATAGILNFGSYAYINGVGTNEFNIGNALNASGALYQSSGSLTAKDTSFRAYVELGAAVGSYGYYALSGGSANFALGGPGFTGMRDGYSGLGNFVQTGGSLTLSTTCSIGTLSTGNGIATFLGGNATQYYNYPIAVGEAGTGVLNIGTEGLNGSGGSATVSSAATAGILVSDSTGTGTINLNGGTLQLSAGTIARTGAGTGTFNFNGGTLQSTATGVTLINNTLSSVNVFQGGANINVLTGTGTASASLLQASGSGVYVAGGAGTLGISSNGGAGYIGAPLVSVSGGSGLGAMAIANISGGSVTSVTLTSPGQNYQVGDILTFSFTGGGSSTAATPLNYTLTASDVASNFGGLTKAGAGNLYMSGTNTYAGPTAISAGTLTVSGSGVLGGGNYAAAVSNSGTLNWYTAAAQTFSGVMNGSGPLNIGAGSVLTLLGSNTYTGPTAINGTLNFAGGAASSGTNGNGGNLLFGTTVANGVLNITTTGTIAYTAAAFNVDLGFVSGASGIINQSSGTFSALGGFTNGILSIGENAGSYGAYNLTGGSLVTAKGSAGSSLRVGAAGMGVYIQTAGTLNDGGYFSVGTSTGGSGVATFTGGNFINGTSFPILVGEAGTGVLNIGTESGGSATLVSSASSGVTVADGAGTGTINFNSGTLQLSASSVQHTGAASGTVNFNGGTLQANTTGLNFLNNTLSSVNIYKGGANFNVAATSGTVSANLLAASGSGVYASGGAGTLGIASGGGNGYLGVPLVSVSGGNGTGALAVASISGGSVSSVTLTNPGQNYQVGDVLTFSFTGGGASTLATSFTYALTANDLASNVGGVTKGGAGNLFLTGASTYGGPTTVSAGTLTVSPAASLATSGFNVVANSTLVLPSVANLTVPAPFLNSSGTTNFNISGQTLSTLNGSGGAVNLNGTALTVNNGGTYAGSIQDNGGSGSLTVAGGSLALTGVSTYSGATNITAGTLAIGGTGLLGGGNYAAAINDNGQLNYNSSASQTYSGVIGGNGGLSVNAGVFTLQGTNSSSGPTTVNAGILAGTGSISGNVTITGGAINLSNGIIAGSLGATGGNWTGVGTVGGLVVPSAGAFTITNGGTLNAASGVVASGGSMYVNGTLASPVATTVLSGALFGGQGSAGTVNVTGGIIEAGQGGTGTLTLTNLAISSGAINETAGQTLLDVTGSNSLSASSVFINLAGVPVLAGTYALIEYSGNVQGSGTAGFSLGSYNPGPRGVYNLISTPGFLDLVVTSDSLVWSGSFGTAWDTATTKNWRLLSSGSATTFLPNDTVIFSDTALQTTVNISSGDVSPARVTFNNNSLGYTLTGANSIAGAAVLTMNGSAGLTIANTNSYTGGTYLNNGTTTLGISNGLPVGGALTMGGTGTSATFNLAGYSQQVGFLAVGSSASGAGQVITNSTGSSILTLTGTNSSVFYGTIQDTAPGGGTLGLTLNAGTLDVSGGTTTYYGATTINSGLLNAAALPNTSGVAISSSGVLNLTASSGTVSLPSLTGNGTATFAAPVASIGSLGNVVLNLAPSSSLTISAGTQTTTGSINGSGASVTFAGLGTYSLLGTNTFSGATTLSSGTINLGSTGMLVNTSSLSIAPGTQLNAGVNNAIGYAGSATWNVAGLLNITNSASLTFPTGGLNLSSGTVTSPAASGNSLGNLYVNANDTLTASGAGNVLSTTNVQLAGATLTLNTPAPTDTLTVSSAIGSITGVPGVNGVTKTGLGTAFMLASYSYTGVTTVSGGTLTFGGSSSYAFSGIGGGGLVVGTSSGNAVLNFASTGTLAFGDYNTNAAFGPNGNTFNVGNASGAVGVINQSSGTVSLKDGNYGGYVELGSAAGGYGYYGLTGGNLNLAVGGLGSGWAGMRIGYNGLGNYLQTGGVMSFNRVLSIGTNAGAIGVFTLVGGTTNSASGTAYGYGVTVGEAGTGTFNLGTESGGTSTFVDNTGLGFVIEDGLGTGTFNLNSGTLQITAAGIKQTGGGTGTFNFNGGTFLVSTSGLTSINNTLSSVNVFQGGANFNIPAKTDTVSANLLQASGSGVYLTGGSLTISSSGGSGYIGAPLVNVAGGSGSGAMAIADVSGGVVTGVTITNPGQGYLPGDMLTFSFTGGGAANSAQDYTATLTAGQLVANAGGVTKTGTGLLLLSGNNTYAGGTYLGGGTLQLGSVSALGTGGLTANTGVLDLNGQSPLSIPSLSGSSGIITDMAFIGTNILTVNQSANTTFGGSFRDGSSTTVGLTLAGTGMLTLSGTNAYSGATLLSAGTLAAAVANALSPNSAFTMNGGVLAVTAGSQTIATSLTLAGSSAIILVNGAGVLDISANISDLTGSGELTLSSTSDTGTLILSGSNSYGGGTTVLGGTLLLEGAPSLAPGTALTIGNPTGNPLAVFSPLASVQSGAVPSPGSSSLAPVPEPGTFALLFVAVGLVALVRKRRNRKQS